MNALELLQQARQELAAQINNLMTEAANLRVALNAKSDTLAYERADTSRRIYAFVQERDALRADLATMTAERDAAQAELQSWTSDLDEWRERSRRELATMTAERDAAVERATEPRVRGLCPTCLRGTCTWHGTGECSIGDLAPRHRREILKRLGLERVEGCSCVRPTNPPPSGGTGDVWQMLIDAMPHHPLRAEMIARRELGIARYGQPLRHGDGRDRALDLREELLDAAAYAFDLYGVHVAGPLLDWAHDPEMMADPWRDCYPDDRIDG